MKIKKIFQCKSASNIAWEILMLKQLLFIWNSNLTGHPIILFAISGNAGYRKIIPQLTYKLIPAI